MLIYGVLAFFLIWLIGLSYIIYITRKHYLTISQGTKTYQIDKILDRLIEDDQSSRSEIDKINKEIKSIKDEILKGFSKVGLIRFNPFGRTTVDQSFVVAMLNKENSGIVINFIYTHEGVRVYSKKIKSGEGDGYQLSEEEKEAIKKSNSF